MRRIAFFFFNDTATTEIYTLSLHDALPISRCTGSAPPSVRRLRVRERLVELRRSRHRELVRSALEPLLRVLAGRLEMQDAVVPDHRERERMRDARVLHPVEEQRGLGAIEDASLGDDAPVREHEPLRAPGDP